MVINNQNLEIGINPGKIAGASSEGGVQPERMAELGKYPPFTVNLMRLMGEFEETREKRGG